eukprot:Opistho-2@69780
MDWRKASVAIQERPSMQELLTAKKVRNEDDQLAIQGPVIFQMFLHYCVFMLIIFMAERLGLAPEIRFPALVPYFFLSLIATQVSRLIYTRSPLSLLPVYISFVPFLVLVVLSREVHMNVAVLWFCSLMTIKMQCGVQVAQHVMGVTILFVAVYAATVGAMTWFYTDTTGYASFRGIVLEPRIEWDQEFLIMFCLMFLGLCFWSLLRYIKSYALTVASRERRVEQLWNANNDLKKELKKIKEEKEFEEDQQIDLSSPFIKVIELLREIQSKPDTPEDVREKLEFAMKAIASSKSVNEFILSNENSALVDDQTSVWLREMLQAKKDTPEAPAPGGRPGGRMSIYDRRSASMSMQHGFPMVMAGSGSMGSGLSTGARHEPMLLINEDDIESYEIDRWDDFCLRVEPKILQSLESADTWDFDVFTLYERTNARPLFYLGYALFAKYELFREYSIDPQKFQAWLRAIESGYRSTIPYHNSTHAADVLQSMNYMLNRDALQHMLSPMDLFAALVACIIHDFDHPGKNNSYLINTDDSLAICYNDKSILENHHAAAAFQLTKNDETNIFSGVSKQVYREVREKVLALVLATDPAQHFDYLSKFKTKLSADSFDYNSESDRLTFMQIAIKCADISNPAKVRALSVEWTNRIMEEFFQQGEAERARNLPVSAFMDREQTSIPKCQVGFIDFIVKPLYEAVDSFVGFEVAMTNIGSNRDYWSQRLKQEEAETAANGGKRPPNKPLLASSSS